MLEMSARVKRASLLRQGVNDVRRKFWYDFFERWEQSSNGRRSWKRRHRLRRVRRQPAATMRSKQGRMKKFPVLWNGVAYWAYLFIFSRDFFVVFVDF